MSEHPEAEQGSSDTPVSDPRIAEAVERLEGLTDQAPAEHVEVYEDVHRVLQESLTDAQGERQDP